MPLYQKECDDCGESFEILAKVAHRNDATECPKCGGVSSHLGLGSFAQWDVQFNHPALKDGYNLSKNRADVIERSGGGKAIKNKETGGYRPAITHTARCPKEGRERNVAILHKLPQGYRLNCEYCGYMWIHDPRTADHPLRAGVKESIRRPRRINTSLKQEQEMSYTAPERGA